jgi:hypothetical protein
VLDFKAIKAIPLTQVLQKYGVALTFSGKYAKARCPLRAHKAGDKDKNFNLNLEQNFWKCWSGSCNEKAGVKGGDVINFVALMESCSQHDAAKRLAEWFHVPETSKAAPRIEKRPDEKAHIKQSQRTDSKPNSSNGNHKSDTKGYMQDVDAWFDDMIVRGDQEDDEQYIHRVRNAVKSRLVQSFRNGKRVAQGLLPES